MGDAIIKCASEVLRDPALQVFHLDADNRVCLCLLQQLVIDDELRLWERDDGKLSLDHLCDVSEQKILIDLILVQLIVQCGAFASSVHQVVVSSLLIDAQVTYFVMAAQIFFARHWLEI